MSWLLPVFVHFLSSLMPHSLQSIINLQVELIFCDSHLFKPTSMRLTRKEYISDYFFWNHFPCLIKIEPLVWFLRSRIIPLGMSLAQQNWVRMSASLLQRPCILTRQCAYISYQVSHNLLLPSFGSSFSRLLHEEVHVGNKIMSLFPAYATESNTPEKPESKGEEPWLMWNKWLKLIFSLSHLSYSSHGKMDISLQFCFFLHNVVLIQSLMLVHLYCLVR